VRRPRLLIVDDSVVIRRELTAAIARDARVEVVGSASNGRIALMKIPLLQPDIVALDVGIPQIDGFATLTAIRREWPRLLVIMLNVPTPLGATATVEALTRGADDYVVKPAGDVPTAEAVQVLSDQLVAKIVSCRRNTEPSRARNRAPSTAAPSGKRIDVVALAVSTGGPGALMKLIPAFPADCPVPILIVQHMPPMFTRLLAERLDAMSSLCVVEGSAGQTPTPGGAWIAPGDLHMAVERDGAVVRLVTHRQPREHSCRPAADVLFRSVAEVYGPHALAVVMTGMGEDGFLGSEQIHAAGGKVLVQDEDSSVVWGMPGVVARAGIADRIVPLSELGAEILGRIWRHRPAPGRLERLEAGVACR